MNRIQPATKTGREVVGFDVSLCNRVCSRQIGTRVCKQLHEGLACFIAIHFLCSVPFSFLSQLLLKDVRA